MTAVLNREHTGVATALTVRLQLVNANSGRPLHGATLRLWPCGPGTADPTAGHPTAGHRTTGRDGTGVPRTGHHGTGTVEVRISDESGWTEFDVLLPAAGPARWPHLHFEIPARPGPDTAAGEIRGRLVLPADAYAAGTLRRTDLATAFGPGEPLLMASVTGDAHRGLVATRTLTVR